MSSSSPKRSASRRPDSIGRGPGFGPRRLAGFATRRPGSVLAAWGLIVLLSLGLIGTLLASGLTSDSKLTNHPESDRAQELIDARLPDQGSIDEVIVVRSDRLVVSDPAFAARVRDLTAEARRDGGVAQISSYLDPGGEILISADRHATLLPVVMATSRETCGRGRHLRSSSVRTAADGFAVHITGENTSTTTSPRSPRATCRQGELQFGLPAALIVLLLVVGTLVGAAIPTADGDPLDRRGDGSRRRHRPGVRAQPVRREHARRDGPGARHRLLAVHRLPAARGAPPRRLDARGDPDRGGDRHPRGRVQRHRVRAGDARHVPDAGHHAAQPRPSGAIAVAVWCRSSSRSPSIPRC